MGQSTDSLWLWYFLTTVTFVYNGYYGVALEWSVAAVTWFVGYVTEDLFVEPPYRSRTQLLTVCLSVLAYLDSARESRRLRREGIA